MRLTSDYYFDILDLKVRGSAIDIILRPIVIFGGTFSSFVSKFVYKTLLRRVLVFTEVVLIIYFFRMPLEPLRLLFWGTCPPPEELFYLLLN